MQNLQNDFAERALIAGLFHNPDLVGAVGEIVKPEDFYETKHELLAETLFSLAENGITVEPVRVYHELANNGRLAQAGGTAYLSELLNPAEVSNMTVDPVGVALIVKDIAKKRRLYQLGGNLMEKAVASEGQSSDDVLEFAETSVVSLIAENDNAENFYNVASLLPEVIDDVKTAKDLPEGAMLGIPTGFTDFDRMTQGLKGGQMIIIAARPGVGKNLALDTPILTVEGWRSMGDIRTGDRVFGLDGKPYPVVLAHDPHFEENAYEVRLEDENTLTAGAGHLWTVEADKAFPGAVLIDDVHLSAPAQAVLSRERSEETLISLADLGKIFGLSAASVVAAERLQPVEIAVQNRADLPDALAEHGKRVALKQITDYTHTQASQDSIAVTVTEVAKKVYSLDSVHNDENLTDDVIPVPYYRFTELVRTLLDVLDAWQGQQYYVGTVDTAGVSALLEAGATVRVPAVQPLTVPHRVAFTWGDAGRSRHILSVRRVDSVVMRCLTVGSPDAMFLAGNGLIPTHNSTIAVDFARNAAFLAGKSVLFFSLEMAAKELVARILSAEARVATQKMKTGDLDETDWMNVREAHAKLQGSNFFIDGNPKTTISRVRSVAARQKLKPEGLDMIVIDYLQLMETSSSRKNGSRENEVSELSRNIKLLAKELDVPIIVLSQLNRKAEERAEGKPLVSDLRESGSLEQDADMVLLIHRPSASDPDNRPGQADLIIGKHRGGPMGTIPLAAMMEYSMFADGRGMVPREDEALGDGQGGAQFAATDDEAPW